MQTWHSKYQHMIKDSSYDKYSSLYLMYQNFGGVDQYSCASLTYI